MEENSKNIDIENEQNKIRAKIDKIVQSGIFGKLTTSLNHFKNTTLDPMQDKNINIYGRLKKPTSAVKKIAQKNITSSEIYDLIAFMFVVDLPENYVSLQASLLSALQGLTYSHLFDGNLPENNGYSSLHLGINANKFLQANSEDDLEDLSAEIQLKTYGMYMAQEATHDSIYKNDSLDNKQKFDMQRLMFPIIEHLTDIEMYKKALDSTVDDEKKKYYESRISELKQSIDSHKKENIDSINQNLPLIDSVFREYIARKNIEKLKGTVSSELSIEQTEGLITTYRNAISVLSNSQSEEIVADTDPTGFKNIDDLLTQFDNKSFNEVLALSNQFEAHHSLLGNVMEVAKKSVGLSDISASIDELQSQISSTKTKNESEQNR